MNKKFSILILITVALLSVSALGCVDFGEIDTETAEFEVSNLDVSPLTIGPGETVEVSVDVENVGDLEGEYTVEVEVNGEILSEDVTLDAGESVTVTFEVTKEVSGEYTVEIEDLSVKYLVTI